MDESPSLRGTALHYAAYEGHAEDSCAIPIMQNLAPILGVANTGFIISERPVCINPGEKT